MLQNISELETKSNIQLSLAQKIVLAETGTVEQVLSILTDAPIQVQVTKQKVGRKFITRESQLVNEKTGKKLIQAKAKVFIENLPREIAEKIKEKQLGIGTIISLSGLETFRKIIEIGYSPATGSIFRKYQVVHKRKIIFEIEEKLLL